jgi:hypothetical protein
LVEPPIAELTRIALMKASRVRMSDGLRSGRDHLDDLLAVSYAAFLAIAQRRGDRCEPGQRHAERLGRLFIVVAVPIVLQ